MENTEVKTAIYNIDKKYSIIDKKDILFKYILKDWRWHIYMSSNKKSPIYNYISNNIWSLWYLTFLNIHDRDTGEFVSNINVKELYTEYVKQERIKEELQWKQKVQVWIEKIESDFKERSKKSINELMNPNYIL